MATTIGYGVMLALLEFSAHFSSIDHDNPFCILENMSECVVMFLNQAIFSNRN